MDWRDYIEQEPRVMGGKPVFKGTRITVEHVLEELKHGMTVWDLLRGHPRFNEDHIRAALRFAADQMS